MTFMISRKILRELIDHKLKDADILFVNRRYASAIYMAGYALELALKLRICKILNLRKGFRKTKRNFMRIKTALKVDTFYREQ